MVGVVKFEITYAVFIGLIKQKYTTFEGLQEFLLSKHKFMNVEFILRYKY